MSHHQARDNRAHLESVCAEWSVRSANRSYSPHEGRKLIEADNSKRIAGYKYNYREVIGVDRTGLPLFSEPRERPPAPAGTITRLGTKRVWDKRIGCWVLQPEDPVPVPVKERVQLDDAARMLSSRFAVRVGRRA